MNTAYLRTNPPESLVQINFHYVNAELQIDRVFNLARSISETVDSCLGRIKANMEKELQKKRRKKKSAPKEDCAQDGAVATTASPDECSVVQLRRLDQLVDGSTVMKDVLNGCAEAGVTDLRLTIFGVEFNVCYNLPWVNQIVLPTSMLSGYIVYPTKLDMECAVQDQCDFHYFKVGALLIV